MAIHCRFVRLISSQVSYDDLYYVANLGTHSTIAGGDHIDKIIINFWVNILNARELNTYCSHVPRVFFTKEALVS